MKSCLAVVLASGLFLGANVTFVVAQTGGACEQAYVQCLNESMNGGVVSKQACENNWRTCVSNKCVEESSGSDKQCLKDPDCDSSCTEFATSKDGLLSCCLGGPEHYNSCPKEVDHVCNPGTPSAYTDLSGPTYNEGDVIPPATPLAPTGNDQKIEVPAFSPSDYPADTVFNEFGGASNPPNLQNDNPLTGEVVPSPLDPNLPTFPPSPSSQLPDYQPPLPPEYQPQGSQSQPPAANSPSAVASSPSEGSLSPLQYPTPVSPPSDAPPTEQAPNPPAALSFGQEYDSNSTFTPSTESSTPSPPSPLQQYLIAPLQQFWNTLQSVFKE